MRGEFGRAKQKGRSQKRNDEPTREAREGWTPEEKALGQPFTIRGVFHHIISERKANQNGHCSWLYHINIWYESHLCFAKLSLL